MLQTWDYLIVTASNSIQARAYETQLHQRQAMGLLPQAREVLLVADPEGRRIGSGGSTLYSLAAVINREMRTAGTPAPDPDEAERILRRLRVLILHAGGDSRRLPAYAACGKIFVPLPLPSDGALNQTLFDRLAATLFEVPPTPPGTGQIVVASGDALPLFDPRVLQPAAEGVASLAGYATPEEASRHGVFRAAADGSLLRYFQKPALPLQAELGIPDREGRALLDLGLMSFGAATAAAWLRAFQFGFHPDGEYGWSNPMRELIFAHKLDIYREICCAMGSETGVDDYIRAAKLGGSAWDEDDLHALFPALQAVPMQVRVAARCTFLHFGTTRQLVESGISLCESDGAGRPAGALISVNNVFSNGASIQGTQAWVEGCQVDAPVSLGGGNVVVGVDVAAPLVLGEKACLDVLPGHGRDGSPVWFVRCYGADDTFKETLEDGARYCGRPLSEWLEAAGAVAEDVWGESERIEGCSLWNARVFPAVASPQETRNWLWMHDPCSATAGQKHAWKAARRYSAAEMAQLANQEEFHQRRSRLREQNLRPAARRLFTPDSPFTAYDLAHALRHSSNRAAWLLELLSEARRKLESADRGDRLATFVFCRIVHSLGTALSSLECEARKPVAAAFPGMLESISGELSGWLAANCLAVTAATPVGEWAEKLKNSAFHQMSAAILSSSLSRRKRPCERAARRDEDRLGRAPARIGSRRRMDRHPSLLAGIGRRRRQRRDRPQWPAAHPGLRARDR